ncbi:unnamed protein product [Heligmosomoides polygyrus]|uniref:Ferlin_C domain-containing protein n=1 Tax=Heligmosomoides polygyrus TaxID=6339 RepID=A0A183GU53_HELPZ|nr:unnamed protein product [Heligmosomoides polygyrus]
MGKSLLGSNVPILKEQKDKDAEKKKDDDVEEEQMYIMGLLELEMALVTEAEAKADPVGKKRKEPNHSPYLPKPLRSSWNMFFITSRIRPCCCWAWHKCGIQLFCWIVAILLLAVAAYGLFVNWPVVTTMLIT